MIFSLVCFAISISASFWLSLSVLIFLCLLALLTFFYSVPILTFKNLRNVSSSKVFVVAFVWAGATVILPILSADHAMTTAVLLTFFQRFLIIIALIIPFEIRDFKFDANTLRTLPQVLGVYRAKWVGVMLLLTCLFIEGFKNEFALNYFSSLLLMCALIIVGIICSNVDQTKYYASFWIEVIPIVWFGLLFLFSNLF
jgi:4-hydroxybenzoate polyprenyltransferase